MRLRRLTGIMVFVLGTTTLAWAQDQQPAPGLAPASARPAIAFAFVDVRVMPMDGEDVEPGQTVLVQGDRIAAIGARDAVTLPPETTIIEGKGRYLVPGLTDAHVHLEGDGMGGPTRPDFGDAPLYLAHGVTTVFNLRGVPAHLEWRRRIERGELIGPTIYTSGEFVNEPRVATEEQVEQEIAAQARDGYDLIKFHEIVARAPGQRTTVGLSHAAYLRMNDAARRAGVPLLGHAPVNLGLDVMLQARQPLAHVGMLSNIHFLPMAGNRAWLLASAAAFGALAALALSSAAAAIVRRMRSVSASVSRLAARVRRLVGLQVLAGLLAAVAAALFLPGGPMFDSTGLRLAFTVLVLFIVAAAAIVIASAAAIWRDASLSRLTRLSAVLASAAGLALACVLLAFWLPVAWRSSDGGVTRIAARVREAGIPVQTTLVVYDALGGPGRPGLLEDPVIGHLRGDVQARWRNIGPIMPSWSRYADFMRKVTGALYRAGVPLMAGTDAMGFPLLPPGSSLHRELDALVDSGLTPYEAMRAATVVPARFLGKDGEFGTIAVGRRADLLLVDGNPLEDITRLRQPAGVMARGRWYPRDRLQQMVAALDSDQ